MSLRYEEVNADECPTALITPADDPDSHGVELQGDDQFALVIGDPGSSAYAIHGTIGGLREFVGTLQHLLDETERVADRH